MQLIRYIKNISKTDIINYDIYKLKHFFMQFKFILNETRQK